MPPFRPQMCPILSNAGPTLRSLCSLRPKPAAWPKKACPAGTTSLSSMQANLARRLRPSVNDGPTGHQHSWRCASLTDGRAVLRSQRREGECRLSASGRRRHASGGSPGGMKLDLANRGGARSAAKGDPHNRSANLRSASDQAARSFESKPPP